MQTIPANQMDPRLAAKQLHHVSHQPHVEPTPLPVLAPLPEKKPQQATLAGKRIQADPFAEMDAMLARDPNVGAIHGLRVALLFNAGLALSGLVIYEIWSMLAF